MIDTVVLHEPIRVGIERASLGKPIVPIVVTSDQAIFFLARGKNTDILV